MVSRSRAWERRLANTTSHADRPVFQLSCAGIVRPADALLNEIQRLYRQLQQLPWADRPSRSHGVTRKGRAYVALETRIRELTDRYKTLSRDQPPGAPAPGTPPG